MIQLNVLKPQGILLKNIQSMADLRINPYEIPKIKIS